MTTVPTPPGGPSVLRWLSAACLAMLGAVLLSVAAVAGAVMNVK